MDHTNTYNHPIFPPRKCHDCGKKTYNYWCDKCREKRRLEGSQYNISTECYNVLIPKEYLQDI